MRLTEMHVKTWDIKGFEAHMQRIGYFRPTIEPRAAITTPTAKLYGLKVYPDPLMPKDTAVLIGKAGEVLEIFNLNEI